MSIEELKKLDMDLEFAPNTHEFEYGGSAYKLTEASGEAATKYKNFLAARIKMDKAGNVTEVGDVAAAGALLVSMCLTTTDAKGIEKKVPLETVQKWPDRLVTKLHEIVAKISDLENDTPESIDKQIAKLQEKRAEIVAKREERGNA